MAAGFVSLLAAFGAPAMAHGAGPEEIAWMFDPDAVVEMHLGGLSEEELDELEAVPDEYVKGTFELKVNGVPKGPQLVDVGIRRKGGFGSSRPIKTGKSGLKLRFDEFVDDQFFFGIKRLTLNNMVQDESMVHETLTYELFHALDLPASRTGYAFLTLNGEKYGLFLNIETLDEVSLPQWFPNTGEPGHLYEADASGVDVRPGAAEDFEVDEGDDEDLSDLEALIAAANDAAGDWSDGMDTVADMERMTAQWAVERYVAHWDGYAGQAEQTPDPDDPIRPNNYYLHSDQTKIFQMMPWGTDQTWEFHGLGFEAAAGGLMFNKCLADASCKELYLEGLTDIHCTTPDLDQGAHTAQLAAMLAPYQDEEDEAKRGYSAEEIEDEVGDVESFVKLRAEQLEQYLTSQGVLGGGDDPCAPVVVTPEPPKVTSDPPQGPPPAPFWIRIGSSRVLGSYVSTRLNVSGAGKATQRVTTRFDGRRVKVCEGQKSRATGGRLTVRCRIPKRMRNALESGPLKLRVRVGFIPQSGTSEFRVRGLTVPKRP